MWEPIGAPTLGREGWWQLPDGWVADAHFRDRMLVVERVIGDPPHPRSHTLRADSHSAS